MSKLILNSKSADNLKNRGHLIVTSVNAEGAEVLWSDVDRELVQNSTGRVPASKFVYELLSSCSRLSSNVNTISGNITSISSVVGSLSTDVLNLKEACDLIAPLSDAVCSISTDLLPLLENRPAKFIGVSETDPSTGVITIDGITYHLSDFNDKNNGNVVYYRTTINNHDHDNPAAGDATSMLYAYIYSNGVLNDVGTVSLDPDQAQQHGSFQKYGYSFFENLSTLIHDDMVCDYAKIKIHKIDGLSDLLSDNDAAHRFLSSKIDGLRVDTDQISDDLTLYHRTTSAQLSTTNLLNLINSNYTTLCNAKFNRTAVVQTMSNCTVTVPSSKAVNTALQTLRNDLDNEKANRIADVVSAKIDLIDKMTQMSADLLAMISVCVRTELGTINKTLV